MVDPDSLQGLGAGRGVKYCLPAQYLELVLQLGEPHNDGTGPVRVVAPDPDTVIHCHVLPRQLLHSCRHFPLQGAGVLRGCVGEAAEADVAPPELGLELQKFV